VPPSLSRLRGTPHGYSAEALLLAVPRHRGDVLRLNVAPMMMMKEMMIMTDKATQDRAAESNVRKDPGQWVTKDESMTGAQRSYVHTLAEEAGEQVDDDMTKAEASKKIYELQNKTGRGKGGR
jgi:hypothetical protein